MVMVFSATFNNISVRLVEETGVPRENHRPAASHWPTLSHNVVSCAPHHERIVVMGTDCIGSCKSNYHSIMTTTPPFWMYNKRLLLSSNRHWIAVFGQIYNRNLIKSVENLSHKIFRGKWKKFLSSIYAF